MNLPVPPGGKQILFLDLETISQYPDYSYLDDTSQNFWRKKARLISKQCPDDPAAAYQERAAIYAEFGKIITIGVGYFFQNEDKENCLWVGDFSGNDEKQLLNRFKLWLNQTFDQSRLQLCAHNGKEFDFPYLSRRMLINEIPLPNVLSLSGKKPWEVNHIDTMELWKFGDWKQYTSLDLLAYTLGVPSSKDDIDGSQVNKVYYKENNLKRISAYCRKDVIVTAQVYLKLNGLPTIAENHITVADNFSIPRAEAESKTL